VTFPVSIIQADYKEIELRLLATLSVSPKHFYSAYSVFPSWTFGRFYSPLRLNVAMAERIREDLNAYVDGILGFRQGPKVVRPIDPPTWLDRLLEDDALL
jgi:hypothetical protein